MLSPFFANDKNIHLERFPCAQVNRSLQAWDATDEQIVNYLDEQALVKPNSHILIFNDNFGALAVNYLENSVTAVSDSYLSHQGIRHNIDLNMLDDSNLTLLASTENLPNTADIILYKIPKSNALLNQQLYQISQNYSSGTVFIAGAKAKDIHSSTLKIIEKYLGATKTSLAVKKSRLVFSQLDITSTLPSPKISTWVLEGSDFTISNLANVFAREKLDLGARFLLEHLPQIDAGKQVIDLGCGNGVIGLSLLAKQPECALTFIDESYMAVATAELNIKNNLESTLNNCQFITDDCLTNITQNSIDVIVCNPPFHQLQATTDHIAWQMFNDSFHALKRGGELRIIGNRQLGYHIKLQRIFGNAKTIASNKKFVILSAIKK